MSLLTYLQTARHLRPVQIKSRLSMLIRRRLLQRSSLLRRRFRAPARISTLPAPLPLPAAATSGEVGRIREGTFTFLSQTAELGRPVRWVPTGRDTLFLYQLHAFEYLLPLGARFRQDRATSDYELFRELVEEWLEASPLAASPSWDPYPTSLRIRNWLHAHALFAPALRHDPSFTRRWLDSLYSQTRYLEAFLERHLLANHLIENARALLLAGLFFQDRRARRWRCKAERILWRELDRQFLADGGHEERSPMYHQLMLELYREVAAVLTALDQPVPRNLADRLRAMDEWLATILHPDGEIPLLNDAVFGMTRRADEIVETSGAKDGLCALPGSGYFAFRDADRGNLAIFDSGPLGPDHQPGHGHCDCLSFELSIAGRRIIVDSGVGTYYGELAWRNYYRSTRAHNTIQIDGAEQSVIWDRFRVARRAHPRGVRWGSGPGLDWVSGAHTGYSRLSGGVTHRRWFCWIARRFWLVVDRLSGRGTHRLESFLHFHPDAEASDPVQRDDFFLGDVRHQGVSLRVLAWGAQEATRVRGATGPIQGWYAPRFNCRRANAVWTLRREAELPIWMAYILSPAAGLVKGHFVDSSRSALRAEIQEGETRYRVRCDERGAARE